MYKDACKMRARARAPCPSAAVRFQLYVQCTAAAAAVRRVRRPPSSAVCTRRHRLTNKNEQRKMNRTNHHYTKSYTARHNNNTDHAANERDRRRITQGSARRARHIHHTITVINAINHVERHIIGRPPPRRQ